MNDVEKKLVKYRAQKEREARFNEFKENCKNKLASYFNSNINNGSKEANECLISKPETNVDAYNENLNDNLSDVSSNTDDDLTLNCWTYVEWIYFILCFVLWVTVYAIFIKLQFGTVYLILSALLGIYLNTRTGPKAKDEVSAYSVFNKGCESIDGTLKAEQFEREIRYGAPAVMK
ncbi:hypothetical protein NQ315_009618 [Exocentrus adspersus]|uniref:SAYSvFN domain-containing protein n=1 Tax=Exocentrus adspersus TaxID=1586481 RepID=A0AAV8WHY7_9CUCU|nr:hypothetical protein NQ315_009618 [Exocentrus adspersus]